MTKTSFVSKGRVEHILPFYLKTIQRQAFNPCQKRQVQRLTQRPFLSLYSTWTRRRVHHLRCYWKFLYSTIETSFANPFSIKPSPILEKICGSFYTPHQDSIWAPISQNATSYRRSVWWIVQKTVPKKTQPKGDWEGAGHHYEFRVNGLERRIHDPYALSSLANQPLR